MATTLTQNVFNQDALIDQDMDISSDAGRAALDEDNIDMDDDDYNQTQHHPADEDAMFDDDNDQNEDNEDTLIDMDLPPHHDDIMHDEDAQKAERDRAQDEELIDFSVDDDTVLTETSDPVAIDDLDEPNDLDITDYANDNTPPQLDTHIPPADFQPINTNLADQVSAPPSHLGTESLLAQPRVLASPHNDQILDEGRNEIQTAPHHASSPQPEVTVASLSPQPRPKSPMTKPDKSNDKEVEEGDVDNHEVAHAQSQDVDAPDFAQDSSHSDAEQQYKHLFSQHPVMVTYEDSAMYLFPPLHEHASETFFLQDRELVQAPFKHLLSSCRAVLGDSITEDVELVLDADDLTLSIGEDSPYAASCSLVDVLDLYVRLCHNEGLETPDPLYVNLSTRNRFFARFTTLRDAVAEGKTLSQARIPEEYDSQYVSGEDEDAAPEVDESHELDPGDEHEQDGTTGEVDEYESTPRNADNGNSNTEDLIAAGTGLEAKKIDNEHGNLDKGPEKRPAQAHENSEIYQEQDALHESTGIEALPVEQIQERLVHPGVIAENGQDQASNHAHAAISNDAAAEDDNDLQEQHDLSSQTEIGDLESDDALDALDELEEIFVAPDGTVVEEDVDGQTLDDGNADSQIADKDESPVQSYVELVKGVPDEAEHEKSHTIAEAFRESEGIDDESRTNEQSWDVEQLDDWPAENSSVGHNDSGNPASGNTHAEHNVSSVHIDDDNFDDSLEEAISSNHVEQTDITKHDAVDLAEDSIVPRLLTKRSYADFDDNIQVSDGGSEAKRVRSS